MLDPFVPSFKLLRFDKSIWDLAIVKLEEKKNRSLKERKNKNTHEKASGLVVTVVP